MEGRRLPDMALVVLGVLGQAAFYAGFGRTFVPLWLRVSVHLAVAAPLLLVPPTSTSVGRGDDVPRSHVVRSLGQMCVVLAGALYLLLAVGSLVLMARGARMR